MFHLKTLLRFNNEFLICRNLLYNNNLTARLNRCYSTSTDYEIIFKPQFSTEEHQKILKVLNTPTVENLRRYKIPQTRIRNIKSWRNKKGDFQSLNDVLEVEGLSVKILEKLCESIINDNNREMIKTEDEENASKLYKKQYLSPTIENLDRLSVVVALHIAPVGISWTRLNNKNHIDDWSFVDFGLLPKKMLSIDTFQLAMTILDQLPTGDVYIFENTNNGSNSLQTGKGVLLSTQQLELTSMLIALINTSPKHNNSFQRQQNSKNIVSNKVYFLKSKLPARLFGTLVGQERVSSVNKITNLLNNTIDPSQPYSSVTLEEELKKQFLGYSAIKKELLAQPLMLAITFMDICVKKNLAACKSVVFKGK